MNEPGSYIRRGFDESIVQILILAATTSLCLATVSMTATMAKLDDYSPISPTSLKQRKREELLQIMGLDAGGVFGDWAKNELATRQMDELEKRIKELDDSTNKVHQEVVILSSSSDRLERLTRILKNLTWVLIVVTLLAAAVPIGLELWRAYHEPPAPVLERPKPTP